MQWDQQDYHHLVQDEAMVLSLQTFRAVQMDFKKAVKNMEVFLKSLTILLVKSL